MAREALSASPEADMTPPALCRQESPPLPLPHLLHLGVSRGMSPAVNVLFLLFYNSHFVPQGRSEPEHTRVYCEATTGTDRFVGSGISQKPTSEPSIPRAHHRSSVLQNTPEKNAPVEDPSRQHPPGWSGMLRGPPYSGCSPSHTFTWGDRLWLVRKL